jgi:glycine/D-amino acid oxidase-like deaminating enzyme
LKTYRAKRLPVHRGPAAWAEILGPYTPAPALDGDATCDVAIIGAGFAGLSAALRLHQLRPNARIVVLEAGALAQGASGRNSGFMIDIPHDLASDDYAGGENDLRMIALNRQAQSFARDAVEQFDINRNYFDQAGKVNGAVSETAHAHNLSFSDHLATLGESSEMLDQQQMQDLTGSGYYRSGLYTPGTVMLQPAGYIRELAQGLRRSAVQIYENTPATGFDPQGTGWQITTPKGRVTTQQILLTNNGHLESVGIERGRLMQLFLFASMSPELDEKAIGGAPRWGVTPSDPMGTTMRRIDSGQGGNRIITRTCAALRPGMQATAADLSRAKRVMQSKFDMRFPQLAGLAPQYTWAGHLCLSLNGVSVMREIDKGVYAACVQNGLGTARGTLTGMAAAELACGQTSDVTEFFTREDRPKRLPPQPFQQIGANTVLRWKEYRATKE